MSIPTPPQVLTYPEIVTKLRAIATALNTLADECGATIPPSRIIVAGKVGTQITSSGECVQGITVGGPTPL